MNQRTPGVAMTRRELNRREFLRLGGVGLAGAGLLGWLGTSDALARPAKKFSLDKSVIKEFEAAADEYGVPVDLLMAMGYVNTRWEMPPVNASAYEKGEPHGRGSYGIMALVQNPFSNTLGAAARLSRIPEKKLKTDRASNIRGGAALLAASAGNVRRSRGATDLLPAVASGERSPGKKFEAVSGIGGGDLYAEQVSQALEDGVAEALRAGDTSVFSAPSSTTDRNPEFSDINVKPPVRWFPAHPYNYTDANRPRSHRITRIIIHVTQGSWSSAINWFRNPGSGVSAHYVIRSFDGLRAQCVSDLNIAYHAGNWRYNVHSIGIEHEGFVSTPKYFTPEMYRSSARLTAYLCRRYRIPIDRQHILGHNEVPGADHTDPGQWWWWSYYMKRVRFFARN